MSNKPVTRFNHLTLGTRDVIATRDFFIQTLGWKLVVRPGNIEVEAAWLELSEGQQIHILHVPNFEVSPFEKEFGRHVAVDYPLAEFPALKERLVAHGAELIAPIRKTPFERFFFKMPEGYLFEVVDSAREPEG